MGEEATAKSLRKTRVADAFPHTGQAMLFMLLWQRLGRFVVAPPRPATVSA